MGRRDKTGIFIEEKTTMQQNTTQPTINLSNRVKIFLLFVHTENAHNPKQDLQIEASFFNLAIFM